RGTTPSGCSRSAAARCSPSTSWWPRRVASVCAAAIASCDFWVSLLGSISSQPFVKDRFVCESSASRIEGGDLGQLLEQLALAVGELRRHHHVELGEEVALAALRLWIAVAAQANPAPCRGAGGDAHRHRRLQRLELRRAAERRFPGRDRQRRVQVVAVEPEAGVRQHVDGEVEVARRAAAASRSALGGEADLLPRPDAARDLELQRLLAAGLRIGEGDGPLAACRGLLQRQLDARLLVVAALLPVGAIAAAAW